MSSDRLAIPEVQLAAAVIQRALSDALTPDAKLLLQEPGSDGASTKTSYSSAVTERQRDEAVRFLVDTSPGWAGAREVWSDALGIDPDIIRRQALRRIPISAIPADILSTLVRRAALPVRGVISMPDRSTGDTLVREAA